MLDTVVSMEKLAGDRYIVISSDGHAGAQMEDYRNYLEKEWLDEFDDWATSYVNPFTDLRGVTAYRNWDSAKRLEETRRRRRGGRSALPEHDPAVLPVGEPRHPPAEDARRLRPSVGRPRAHNRWLADFCADTPGRRAGMAQIFLNDIDDTVAEIRWAREHGLFGGILLPGVPPDSGLAPLIAPEYEPIWAVCEELDMPINNHTGQAGPDFGDVRGVDGAVHDRARMVLSPRVLAPGLRRCVPRHPKLKLVLTEQSAGWVPSVLAMLDHQYERFKTPGAAEAHFGGELAKKMDLSPSEYWARNCFAGASFFRPNEAELRYEIGVDRIMWGQDYPHVEGTYPYTTEALRNTFAGIDSDEVAAMVGTNAAGVYGFDLDALARVAERVGPTVEEVAVPLDKIPEDTVSIAFAGEAVKPW